MSCMAYEWHIVCRMQWAAVCRSYCLYVQSMGNGGLLLASARAKRTYSSIYVFTVASVYRNQLLALAIIIWHSSNEPRATENDSHSIAFTVSHSQPRTYCDASHRWAPNHITYAYYAEYQSRENEKTYPECLFSFSLCIFVYFTALRMCVVASLLCVAYRIRSLTYYMIIYKSQTIDFRRKQRIVFSPFDVVAANASFRWDQFLINIFLQNRLASHNRILSGFFLLQVSIRSRRSVSIVFDFILNTIWLDGCLKWFPLFHIQPIIKSNLNRITSYSIFFISLLAINNNNQE